MPHIDPSGRTFLADVLDAIEERESALLVWGVVDGYFTFQELAEIINPRIDVRLDEGCEDFIDPEGVIEALLDLKWLIEVESRDDGIGYRSRMGETVRLLLRLRQLFPRHCRTEMGWQDAPNLVADFRFQRRKRLYPKRGIRLKEVLAELRSVTDDPVILEGIRAQIEGSPPLKDSGLAGFQIRAAQRILRSLSTGKPLASIVCAGTGSGKTLAFYLPALASIARHRIVNRSERPWVKVVAIYPRTELLKDQLREVLTRTVAMRGQLRSDPKPEIRIGALYGDTPRSSKHCGWRSSGNDKICPTLRCLTCGGELRWKAADLNDGRERLTCSGPNCSFSIDGSLFPLTRESMARQPPDILFSTTEMLNRRLSDNQFGHLFGVGGNALRPPELVLLDEVHTYEGRHGAQVAYLLRRWQRLVDQSLRFVGLSATLREAGAFFSALTGNYPNLVGEISPKSEELVAEGAEYMVALRGDPVSQSALLSTTIQTAMLLERCLDPKARTPTESQSNGAFGQRTFAFTDDLDVTNRLFFNLLDAEGRDSFGNPDMREAPNGGLAVLRRQGLSRLRYFGGQDWRMCESLGHNLSTRMVIERVSSQDRGVKADADVIVATAALEVGFDDPAVGAVVQHKAPRGTAGFLQRKGRAGRTKGMRPWMVTVLSDYGRDRIAYQNYDQLFDPALPVRTLPLGNRYITRMQAVYGLIDFLGRALQSAPNGSVWDDLAKPPWSEPRRARLTSQLRAILESETATEKLSDYLSRALRLPGEEIEALLWEYPRPLMTTAIPTALRRLLSGWRANGIAGADFQVPFNPLPDFVPASLFADLNLAEVQIKLPHGAAAAKEGTPSMPLFAALREFAPGRVSRRFGVGHGAERYWLPPPDEAIAHGTRELLELGNLASVLKVGDFSIFQDGQVTQVPVYRPFEITPARPPRNIGDTSNARLIWHTQMLALGPPNFLSPPTGSTWGSIVREVGFCLHAAHAPVEMRRFATGSIAEIGIGRGEKRRVQVDFAKDGVPIALGTSFTTDGVVFKIAIPQYIHAKNPENATKWRALRTARFFDNAWRGISLPDVSSPFLREWLAQIQLSAITYEAIRSGQSLEAAASALADGGAEISLVEVLAVLFQSQVVDTADEEVSLGGEDRLRRDLEDLLKEQTIKDQLTDAATCLWKPIDSEWEQWLQGVYLSTMASAALRALGDLCPTLDVNDLVVDLGRGPIAVGDMAPVESTTAEIWITELAPGGSGLIEEFMRAYSEDPRRFFSMVRAAVEMGEFELIDQQLTKVLSTLTSRDRPSTTRDAIDRIRKATGHRELTQLSSELRAAMVREGFSPFHGLMVSLSSRLLRPGAGPAMDSYLSSVLTQWEREERRLGIEIDLRVLCYWLSQSAEIDDVVSELGFPAASEKGSWRMSAIYGLLWARGRMVRQAPLQLRSPFSDLPSLERLILLESLSDERSRVSVENDNWLQEAGSRLADGQLVTLICSAQNRIKLSRALETLLCNPVDTGYLRAYPRLQGVRQTSGEVAADFELVEAIQ